MIMRLATPARDALNNALARLIDAAGSAGSLDIYMLGTARSTMPATPQVKADPSLLLGSLTLSHPCAEQSSGGIMNFSAVSEEDAAKRDGHAAWARLRDGDGNAVIDWDVGDAESDAVIKLNTADIRKGGPIRIKSITITAPGA
jgi:hypothetical protein